jgi:hypothetical protein
MTTLLPRRTQITVVERMRRPPAKLSNPASEPPLVYVENRRGDPAGGITTDSFILPSLYAFEAEASSPEARAKRSCAAWLFVGKGHFSRKPVSAQQRQKCFCIPLLRHRADTDS